MSESVQGRDAGVRGEAMLPLLPADTVKPDLRLNK